jgi:hypothetical protein
MREVPAQKDRGRSCRYLPEAAGKQSRPLATEAALGDGQIVGPGLHLFLFIPWHPLLLLRSVKWQPNHRSAELPWATDGRRRDPHTLCDSRDGIRVRRYGR